MDLILVLTTWVTTVALTALQLKILKAPYGPLQWYIAHSTKPIWNKIASLLFIPEILDGKKQIIKACVISWSAWENAVLLSLRLNPVCFEINGKISLTSLDIDYGHGELKTFMNINGLYWSMCLFVCCTLSGICDSIFVVYLEVTEKANFM